jgi:signal transduction histidine kinase
VPVTEAAAIMKPRTEENAIELTVDLSPELLPFYFDPEAVQRCILNLWGNAIDACIEAQPSRKKQQLHIQTKKVDGWGCEYRVSDTGNGMDASTRNKIFQGFFSTKGTSGTGIGLMMTKKIVEQHGGEIEVLSDVGSGSTFIIRLPAKMD